VAIESNIPEEFQTAREPQRDWSEIVAWVGDLPPLPTVASEALSSVEDPDTTANELTEVLKKDTALAARVMKIANSAMFSRQREITTLNQAVMVIGFKALKGVIVAATLRQIRRKQSKLETEVWQNSTCTALAANAVARRLKKLYIDEIFLLGLLHDLGKLVLLQQIPEEYKEITRKVEEGSPFLDAENEVLGFAHPLIGALVAKKWNFSPEICQVILHSDDPIDTPLVDVTVEKTAIIKFANFVSRKLGYGNPAEYPELDEEYPELAGALGIEDIEGLEAEVQEAYIEQSSIYD